MASHLQMATELLEGSSQMRRHRWRVDAQQRCDLFVFPVEPVDQHHDRSLPVRLLCEGRGKRWFDVRHEGDGYRWENEPPRRANMGTADAYRYPIGFSIASILSQYSHP